MLTKLSKTITNNHQYVYLFCLGCIAALGMAPVYLWPLTLVAYASLVFALINARNWKHSACQSFVFFLGFHLCGLYWVSSSLFVDFSTWWWALPLSFIGLPILCALFPTLLVIPVVLIPRALKFLFIACALGAADVLRAYVFTGFPWNFPVHGMVNNISMVVLPALGIYGLNFVVILLACLAALHRQLRVWIAIIAFGLWLLPFSSVETAHTDLELKNVVLVQANIKQHEKWDPSLVLQHLETYISMSKAGIKSNESYIIIWPETATSENLLSYPVARRLFNQFLSDLPEGSVLVTGYLNHRNGKNYNSLKVFNRDGEELSSYDKHHLVPFGEYMPLGIDTITGFNGFSSGLAPHPIQVSGMNFLPLICYEIIFPRYMRHLDAYDFVLNITNDSWFGNSAGPYQHLDQARMRAIEFRKPVLRLSGNGVSGLINSKGDLEVIIELNAQQTYVFE